jgi:predicted MFS family arabinose efflux permease
MRCQVVYRTRTHLGAGFGGLLLDHFSIAVTMLGGGALLILGALVVGNGRRLQPGPARPD